MKVERRRFLQATVGAAAVFAGCGGDTNQAQGPIAGERGTDSEDELAGEGSRDVNVLNDLLDLEYQAVAAYTLAERAMSGDTAREARRFRDHEREHARAIQRLIKEAGGRANEARSDYGFERPKDEQTAIRMVANLENKAIAAYTDAITRLNGAEMRATAATIVNGGAQHLVVLHQALDQRSVPAAFVTGEVQETEL